MTLSPAIRAAQARAASDRREYRYLTVPVELRGGDDTTSPRQLVGHAAVFNTDTQIGDPAWGWLESIAPGAFRDSIATDDIRALFNHDANLVLGRNRSGTLKLSEDTVGLHTIITPGDTTAGRDMVAHVERGDVTQMSFGFVPETELWEELPDGTVRRTLQKVQLWDVSPVTFAAFPTTDVAVREARAAGLLPARSVRGSSLTLAQARLALATLPD